jgi:CheY-like chemotaxis protein
MRRVLIVEDDEVRCAWFRRALSGAELDVTCDVAQAVEWLSVRDYAVVLLDHDLTEEHYYTDTPDDAETGYAVALWLSRHPDRQRDATVIVHSLNYPGAQRMIEALRASGRDAEHIPFHYLQTGLRF